MSRMHRLFGVTMIEKGVSRLVSVDLGGAEQLLAAEESHPADLPQVAARHFPPFVSSVVGTNGGRNGRYGLSRTDNQTAQKHQQSRKPVRPKLDQRIEPVRSEEHTSELQSLMRISYAVFCLTIKINNITFD